MKKQQLPKAICEKWNLPITKETTPPVLTLKIQNLLEDNITELLNTLYSQSIKEDEIYSVLKLESAPSLKAERICELVLKHSK